MKNLLCLLLLLLTIAAKAQYPFEKFPAIKYKVIPFKILVSNKTRFLAKSESYKGYAFELEQSDGNDIIRILYKGKYIQQFNEDIGILQITLEVNPALYAADVDGNELVDFKLKTWNNGSGLAGSRMNKAYFFNKGNNKFSFVYFMDFDDQNERDFNNDGHYEIVGRSYLSFNNHGYWVFDLYNFDNKRGLINVSKKYHYPILIQFLEKDNYSITNMINRKKMMQFTKKTPDYYQFMP
ncbi:hypothetical protein EOD41_00675 [Mucilaginibacter limnophilus]|uniref:VCBS repeat-containing protein n=1 Tax=Mucilaginibacter limnophilus TaxID=1932778 RepID=A0A3S2VPS5_9SPHI|nr:hypothetical protein [Mucilaginibacter limnophilus]RVU02487.1 hypothetical protein EOD41_00675 [Mucilaginibacter limnophilus]